MTSSLRNILFRILNSLNIILKLRDTLQTEQPQFGDDEIQRIRELTEFLRQLQVDTHLYLSSEKMEKANEGKIFINFITALSLTEDQWLSRGPAYAMANIALDSDIWAETIKQFNDDKEEELNKHIEKWIFSLNRLADHQMHPDILSNLNQMLERFEQTSRRLEQAMTPDF